VNRYIRLAFAMITAAAVTHYMWSTVQQGPCYVTCYYDGLCPVECTVPGALWVALVFSTITIASLRVLKIIYVDIPRRKQEKGRNLAYNQK
jgi:hypothetical protein